MYENKIKIYSLCDFFTDIGYANNKKHIIYLPEYYDLPELLKNFFQTEIDYINFFNPKYNYGIEYHCTNEKMLKNFTNLCRQIYNSPKDSVLCLQAPINFCGDLIAYSIKNNVIVANNIEATNTTAAVQALMGADNNYVSYKETEYVVDNRTLYYYEVETTNIDAEIIQKVSQSQLNKFIKQVIAQIINVKYELQTRLDEIETKEQAVKNLQSNATKTSLVHIADLPLVKDVFLTSLNLIIHTEHIYGKCSAGNTYSFGEYEININLLSQDIKIWSKTGTKYAYTSEAQHPHVFNDGGACFGTTSDLIATALSDNQLDIAIISILAFLQQANLDDAAGVTVTAWDRVEMDENGIYYVVEEGQPYREEEYCPICDSTMYEDESGRCYDCDIMVCDDCIVHLSSRDKYVCVDCYDDYITCNNCKYETKGYCYCDICDNYYCESCYDGRTEMCINCLETKEQEEQKQE